MRDVLTGAVMRQPGQLLGHGQENNGGITNRTSTMSHIACCTAGLGRRSQQTRATMPASAPAITVL